MKITFLFSDSSDYAEAMRHNVKSHIEIPDDALALPDCKNRILALAQLVGEFTQACLLINCSTLHFNMYVAKESRDSRIPSIRFDFRKMLLRFERWDGSRVTKRHITIFQPVSSPVAYRTPSTRGKGDQSLYRFLLRPSNISPSSEAAEKYVGLIQELAEHCTYLLNRSPLEHSQAWKFAGFHPCGPDKAGIIKAKKATKKRMALEAKAQQRASTTVEHQGEHKQNSGSSHTSHTASGAVKRFGAQPGRFKGIWMRSQTEIRCAAELESRQIRWIYEPERLGDEQYLVDFYLPDLKCWIEVKWGFEPRDKYQLPQVASYLKRERGEQLYVYFPRKAFAVTEHGFTPISHEELWFRVSSVT